MRVEVISSRPQLADWLFQGKTPVETADLAGRVFTLCGQAQRLAATAACAAAQSDQSSAVEWGSLQQAVLMETALEHAWRLLVDWPVQVGLPAEMNPLRVLRQAAALGPTALADALDAILQTLPDGPQPPTPSHQGEGGLKIPSPLAGQGQGTKPPPPCGGGLGGGDFAATVKARSCRGRRLGLASLGGAGILHSPVVAEPASGNRGAGSTTRSSIVDRWIEFAGMPHQSPLAGAATGMG